MNKSKPRTFLIFNYKTNGLFPVFFNISAFFHLKSAKINDNEFGKDFFKK